MDVSQVYDLHKSSPLGSFLETPGLMLPHPELLAYLPARQFLVSFFPLLQP